MAEKEREPALQVAEAGSVSGDRGSRSDVSLVAEVGRASASSPEPLLVDSPRRVADSLLGSRVGADAANANDDLEMTASGGVGSVTVHVVGVRYKWVF